jgi:transcriptional regulator with XRE-family HTH domain
MIEPTPISEFAQFRILFNRERYRQELAEGIYRLMQRSGVNRTQLAALLGVTKGRVSQVLSGDDNLQADTIADICLVLGRAAHLSLGR